MKFVGDYLKTEEPELWDWHSSNRARAEHADHVRLDLLKSTYRIERETQPELYDTAETLARRFGVAAPLTIYQVQSAGVHLEYGGTNLLVHRLDKEYKF